MIIMVQRDLGVSFWCQKQELTLLLHFASLTQFDVTVQREEDVPGLQVSVDDVVIVQINQGLQSLLTHHSDLRLCQGSLQFCRGGQGSHKHMLSIPEPGIY